MRPQGSRRGARKPRDGVDRRRCAPLRLGEPAIGGLRLVFAPGDEPDVDELARLGAFGDTRCARRPGRRANERPRRGTGAEPRAAAVSGRRSRSCRCPTPSRPAVDKVAELLGTDRGALYLRQAGGLKTAAGARLAGPHLRVAEGLLDEVLGTFGSRPVVEIRNATTDLRLGAVRDAVGEAGIEAAVVVPLRSAGELIGLLVAYLPATRRLGESESSLLAALAVQLAVVVQNAGLHEETGQARTRPGKGRMPSDSPPDGSRRSTRSHARSRRASRSTRPSPR